MVDLDDWIDYDPGLHDEAIRAHGYEAGTEWLEGEEIPSADDLLRGYEDYRRVSLPTADGDDLARVRRLVKAGFRAGKADVA